MESKWRRLKALGCSWREKDGLEDMECESPWG